MASSARPVVYPESYLGTSSRVTYDVSGPWPSLRETFETTPARLSVVSTRWVTIDECSDCRPHLSVSQSSLDRHCESAFVDAHPNRELSMSVLCVWLSIVGVLLMMKTDGKHRSTRLGIKFRHCRLRHCCRPVCSPHGKCSFVVWHVHRAEDGTA